MLNKLSQNDKKGFQYFVKEAGISRIFGYIPFDKSLSDNDLEVLLNELHKDGSAINRIELDETWTELYSALSYSKPKCILVSTKSIDRYTIINLIKNIFKHGINSAPNLVFLKDNEYAKAYELINADMLQELLSFLLEEERYENNRLIFGYVVGYLNTPNFSTQETLMRNKNIQKENQYIQILDDEDRPSSHILNKCIAEVVKKPNNVLYIQSLGLLGENDATIHSNLIKLNENNCGLELKHMDLGFSKKSLIIGDDLKKFIEYFENYTDMKNLVELRNWAFSKRIQVDENMVLEVKKLKKNGLTQKKISEHLNISVPTVARIYKNLSNKI